MLFGLSAELGLGLEREKVIFCDISKRRKPFWRTSYMGTKYRDGKLVLTFKIFDKTIGLIQTGQRMV
jgi:hypothetical protein